ncbi:hypothetical protein JB92DRAFT_3094040 [Gautieria morchelliformis]|nr:hypothetical protein JB92DRAFT_3094040 [Gautieria morchelliformis]
MTSLHRLSLSHVTQEEGGRILTALSGYSLWYLLCVSPFTSRSCHVQMTSPVSVYGKGAVAFVTDLFSVRDFNCGQFTRGSRSRRPKSVQREQEEVANSKLCRFISGQTYSKTRKLHRLGVIDKSVHVDPVILDVSLEDFWIDSFKRELWVVLTNRCTGSRHMRRPVYEK